MGVCIIGFFFFFKLSLQLHRYTTYIHIKSHIKVVWSINLFVVITELCSYVKWLVSLPPTPGDFSFSTSILITLMKMIKFTWIRESEQKSLQNLGVHNNFHFQNFGHMLYCKQFTYQKGYCNWSFYNPPNEGDICVVPAPSPLPQHESKDRAIQEELLPTSTLLT